MKKIKFLKVIVFLALPFLIYWVNWWLEDISIRKEGLERIAILLEQPKLKEAEILYFEGTHKGKERDAAGRHFILYSLVEIQLPNLKSIYSKVAQNYPDTNSVRKIKGFLEEDTGHSLGDILDMELYRKDFNIRKPDGSSITIREVITNKGFYYDIRHAWAV